MTINHFILHGEEITPVRKLLYLKAFAGGAPLKEYEVTGNPAVFSTNVAKPLSGFTIPFLPVQQGTGDPSPDNVRPIIGWQGLTAYRTGVNLFDPAERDDSYAANIQFNYAHPLTLPVGTYTASCSVECSGIYISEGNTPIFSKYNSTFITFTLTEPKALKFNFYKEGIDHSADCQLEVGETATPYAEYTGQSYPVTFPALGKNLCDGKAYSVNISRDIPQVLSLTPVTSPFTTANHYSGVGFVARVNANVTYALSSDVTGANVYFYCGLYASLDDVTDRSNILQYATTTETFTPIADGYLVFMRYNASSGTEVTWSYAQCEKGSSHTAYEPFTNTVYGGTLDAVQRVLTNGWNEKTVSEIRPDKKADHIFQCYFSDRKYGMGVFSIISDTYKTITQVASTGSTIESLYATYGDGIYINSGSGTFYICDSRYTDVDTFKEEMADVQIVYELATPVEIPLSDIPVPVTLIGDNTIWTDTNGSNTIKYKKKG